MNHHTRVVIVNENDDSIDAKSLASGFGIFGHDAIVIDETSNTTHNYYTYKMGGISGVTIATITCTFSDATTKLVMTSVVKS